MVELLEAGADIRIIAPGSDNGLRTTCHQKTFIADQCLLMFGSGNCTNNSWEKCFEMGACVTHAEGVSAAYQRNDGLFQNASPLTMKEALARKSRGTSGQGSYNNRKYDGPWKARA